MKRSLRGKRGKQQDRSKSQAMDEYKAKRSAGKHNPCNIYYSIVYRSVIRGCGLEYIAFLRKLIMFNFFRQNS